MSRLFDELYAAQRGGSGDEASDFDLLAYVGVVVRHWKVLAIAVALALIAGVLHFVITPRKYRATARIQIERRSVASATGEFNPWLEGYSGVEFYPTQYELLKSRGLAQAVVRRLRLWEDEDFDPAGGRSATPSSSQSTSVADDDAMVGRLALHLLSGLQIEPVHNTQLVRVSYVAPTPKLAAKVANGVVDAYIRLGVSTRMTDAEQASRILSQEIDSLKSRIADQQSQLNAYQQRRYEAGVDTADAQISKQRIDQLNQERTAAVNDRIAKKTAYDRLMATPDRDLVDLNTGAIGDLRKRWLEDRRKYDTMGQTYKPDWPEMVDLKQKIDQEYGELHRLIAEQATAQRSAGKAEWEAASSRERALTEELHRVGSETLEAKSAEDKVQSLKTELASLQSQLEDKQKRLLSMGSSSQRDDNTGTNVRVIDQALVPGGPFRPSLRRDLSMATGIGLLLGIGLIVLLEYLDRTIQSPEQLERETGLPTLGVIPDVNERGAASRYGYTYGRARSKTERPGADGARLRRTTVETVNAEMLPFDHPRLAAAEAYRGLRTALLLSSAEKLRSVVITSANAAEGKTVTSINLAIVMAQLGRSVLLVDADLRWPGLHKIFEISNRTGLVTHLTGGGELNDVIQETAVPNLFIIPSGPTPPNPSELLSSHRMRLAIDAMRSNFDFVVFDSPPSLAVTDATVVGAEVDGVVLCCRAGKLLRDESRACRERLGMAGVRILGTVLNCYVPKVGIGRGYPYYYQSYVDDEQDSAAHPAA